MRAVFFGTPAYVTPVPAALEEAGFAVAGVVTQADRPAGRGRAVTAPPAALWARDRGVPVLQPASLRSAEAVEAVASLAPDVIVVASYGRILPPGLLALPPLGCINIHPSLLPRHRGPSPAAEAILQGDAVTGVTIMLMDERMDAGPVLAQEQRPIDDADTAGGLTARLFDRGAALLVDTLPRWAVGAVTPVAQDEAHATYSRKLTKDDGALAFTLAAADLHNRVRAMTPWPGAFAVWNGGTLRILRTLPLPPSVLSAGDAAAPPGRAVALRGAPTPLGIVTGDGVLGVLELQREGRRPADAAAFLRGQPGMVGATLSS